MPYLLKLISCHLTLTSFLYSLYVSLSSATSCVLSQNPVKSQETVKNFIPILYSLFTSLRFLPPAILFLPHSDKEKSSRRRSSDTRADILSGYRSNIFRQWLLCRMAPRSEVSEMHELTVLVLHIVFRQHHVLDTNTMAALDVDTGLIGDVHAVLNTASTIPPVNLQRMFWGPSCTFKMSHTMSGCRTGNQYPYPQMGCLATEYPGFPSGQSRGEPVSVGSCITAAATMV